MNEASGLGLVWLLLAAGLFALSRRRYSTVWSGSVLRPLALGLGVAFVISAGFRLSGILFAVIPFTLAIFSSFRSRDFLVLFGRSEPLASVHEALHKLGATYTNEGRTVRVERPRVTIALRHLPLGSTWISISSDTQTPKLTLLERLLHKLLANQSKREGNHVSG